MDAAEMYLALQQKTVDGVDNAAVDLVNLKLFEVSKFEGVLRVAGSAQSAEEKIAPISPDVSEQSCSADGTFARVILNTAH